MCSSQAPSIPCEGGMEGGTEADSQAHRAAELYLNANSHRETLMPMIRNAVDLFSAWGTFVFCHKSRWQQPAQ